MFITRVLSVYQVHQVGSGSAPDAAPPAMQARAHIVPDTDMISSGRQCDNTTKPFSVAFSSVQHCADSIHFVLSDPFDMTFSLAKHNCYLYPPAVSYIRHPGRLTRCNY